MSDTDEKLKLYLDTVDGYQQQLEKSHKHLRNGFIELAHARQARPIGQTSYDLTMKPGATVAGFELETHATRDTLLQFGAWPPSSLRVAKSEFSMALKDLVDLVKSQRVASRLANELEPSFSDSRA